jgi:hypothetical protein
MLSRRKKALRKKEIVHSLEMLTMIPRTVGGTEAPACHMTGSICSSSDSSNIPQTQR